MFRNITPSDGSFVGVRIREEVTPQEAREITDLIAQHFNAHGPVRLLVVYEANPGLAGAENLYEDMRFAKLAGDKLNRMAVIGNHTWENTWVGLFGLFGGIETRFFPQEEADAALTWLRE